MGVCAPVPADSWTADQLWFFATLFELMCLFLQICGYYWFSCASFYLQSYSWALGKQEQQRFVQCGKGDSPFGLQGTSGLPGRKLSSAVQPLSTPLAVSSTPTVVVVPYLLGYLLPTVDRVYISCCCCNTFRSSVRCQHFSETFLTFPIKSSPFLCHCLVELDDFISLVYCQASSINV